MLVFDSSKAASLQDKPVDLPEDFNDVIAHEYTTKYLERIGASPTPDNIASVLSKMPLKNCDMKTAWRSRGWISDNVSITAFVSKPVAKHGQVPKTTEPKDTR